MLTKKELFTYCPPPFAEGWNDLATQLAGRLVTDYRGLVNSGEELYDCYGEEIAQKWVEIDADPNPKYNWETVWKSLVVRFFDADKDKPLAPRAESRVKASQNPEVLVMNRFDKVGTPCGSGSLAEALETHWEWDAHFQPVVADEPSRQKKTWDFMFSYLVFDVDMPDHAALELPWLEEQISRIEESGGVKNYHALYTTNNGYRIVYKPLQLMTKEEQLDMRKIYSARLKEVGVEVDAATKDYSRLYRLPYVVRDGVPTEPVLVHVQDFEVEIERIPKEVYNYRIEYYEDSQGKERTRKVGLQLPEITKNILEVTDGWPKTIQERSFYVKDGKLKYLYETGDFVAWLSNYADLHIHSGAELASKTEIFKTVRDTADYYESISKYPFEPMPEGIYLLCDIDYVEGTEKLDELLAFFTTASPIDKVLLKAAFVTPMLEILGGRPAFVIDSTSGRGAGKTSVVDTIGDLFGGVISVPTKYFKSKHTTDEVNKSLMDELGRQKRVVLVDNVAGFFGSDMFAEALTRKTIQGRLSYGKGTEFRRNDLTWYLTANDAEYDADAISRSVFLKLGKHKSDPNWEKKVGAFIETHREQILGEIRNLIRKDSKIAGKLPMRYGTWCEKVLKNCCTNASEYNDIYKAIIDNKDEFDADKKTVFELVETLKAISTPGVSFHITDNELHQVHKSIGGLLSARKLKGLVANAIKSEYIEAGTLSQPTGSQGRITRSIWGGFVWGREEDVTRMSGKKKEVNSAMLLNEKIETRWK